MGVDGRVCLFAFVFCDDRFDSFDACSSRLRRGLGGTKNFLRYDKRRPCSVIFLAFSGAADYQKALNLIAEGLKANPHSAQLRFQRCVVYERMGDRQKAKDGFERMIRTYPEIPEPYNNLAGIYSREGNLTRAEELLVKALALRPNFALAHMNLGNLYLAKAKNAYNSAIKTGGNKEKLNANIRAIDKLLAD